MSDSAAAIVKVRCPSCKKKLGFAQSAVGRTAKCPGCQHVFRVDPPPPVMSAPTEYVDGSTDRVTAHCPSCDRRLTFVVTAIGHKAKCAACECRFMLEPPAQPESQDQTEAAAGSDEQADGVGDLFSDFASAEQNADLIALAPEEEDARIAETTAPAVAEPPRPGTRLKYEAEVADADPGIFTRMREAAGPLAKGCILSFIAALAGAFAWLGIGMATRGYEVPLAALVLGLVTGCAMNFGTKSESQLAGAIAAGFTFFGILLGKLMLVSWLFWASISAAMAAADREDTIEYQREALVWIQAGKRWKSRASTPTTPPRSSRTRPKPTSGRRSTHCRKAPSASSISSGWMRRRRPRRMMARAFSSRWGNCWPAREEED